MKNEYSHIADKVDDMISNLVMTQGLAGFEFFDFVKYYFERHQSKQFSNKDEQLLDVIDDLFKKDQSKPHLQPIIGATKEQKFTLKELEKTDIRNSKSFYIYDKIDNGNKIERFISKEGDISNKEFSYRLVEEIGLFTDAINIQRQYFIVMKRNGRIQLKFSDVRSENVLKYVDASACMDYKNYIKE